MKKRIKNSVLVAVAGLLLVVFVYAHINGGVAQTTTDQISWDSPASFPVDI